MKVFTILMFLMLLSSACNFEEEKSNNNRSSRRGGESGGGNNAVQIPSTPWIKQFGDTTNISGGDSTKQEFCYSVAVDFVGNVYCAGYTSGSLGENGGGNEDAFVLKLNANGEIMWAKQFGSSVATTPGRNASQADYCYGVAVDNNGNVYCAGSTKSSLGEGNGGGSDAFITKLNSEGNIEWIKQIGGTTNISGGDSTQNDYCNAVAVDNNGNVYCSGQTFGSLGEINGGNADAFVLKLNPRGELQWIKQIGSGTTIHSGNTGASDNCNAVAVDNNGNVYCAGYTGNSLGENFGGASDAFVMKLNSNGEIQWFKQLGATTNTPGGDTTQADYCRSIALDQSGNIYCAGETTGSLGEVNGGSEDVFVMKLSSNGNIQWIKQLGATTNTPGGDTSRSDFCYGLAVDDNQNVYCSGKTKGALGELNGGNVREDAFTMKLNQSGNIDWIKQLGNLTSTPGNDHSMVDTCYSTAVDQVGNVYCAGSTSGSLGEGNSTFTQFSPYDNAVLEYNSTDLFIMKLNSEGSLE